MRYAIVYILTLAGCLICGSLCAQDVKIHSHNDYQQRVPLYQAYAQQLASIEADVFATGRADEVLVAHDRKDLPQALTLDQLYIRPLVSLYRQHGGRAWRHSEQSPVLLIDLKMPADSVMHLIVAKLDAFPDVFDPQTNPLAVRVVISGSVPDATRFDAYPAFIYFDGSRLDYTDRQLQRIYMISLNLRRYTQWDGRSALSGTDRRTLTDVIRQAHALGKPIRFWGTPDTELAWKTFRELGVDYINTDQPEACAAFFRQQ